MLRFALGTAMGLALLPVNAKQESRLAVIRQAPAFSLANQDGAKVNSKELHGKVCLVSFIFTTCSGSCPATTHKLSQIQAALKKEDWFQKDRFQLVSITLDPLRDTPETLRGYMKLYDCDPASWSFLTGTPEEVQKTLTAWNMWAKPATNGQLDHPSRIFLVDKKGQVREIYHLGFLKTPWVVDDIKVLTKEAE